MNNTPVRITVGSEFSGLPELSDHQRLLLKQITEGDAVLRGAPGSGKTTLLLAAVAELVRNDHSFLVLTPDRLRADQLMPAVQALAPNAVRPVRTPIGWAYSIVSQWRNTRDQPLGDVELLTGANMDRMVSQLLEETAIQWPEELSDTIRSLPAFRMELRDLIDTAAESGTTAENLEELGRIRAMEQWVSLAPLLKKWNELPQLGVEFRGTMLAHGAGLGRQAAQLLTEWDDRAQSAGVRISTPLPQYLLIDDLQDCTPSLLALLHVAHQLGSRIIAFSNPDLSVTSYKRGYAHMDLDLARILDVQIEDCGGSYVGTPQLHALNRSLASRITQSGPAGRRNAPFAGDSERGLGEQGVHIHNCASLAQMGAALGYQLRSHYLRDNIPWSQQVVIVRSQSLIQQARRALKRSKIPLAGGQQAFNFASNSMTSALLKALIPNEDNGVGVIDRWLRSDLISIDALHVSSLLHNYVWAHSDQKLAQGRVQHLSTDTVSRILQDPSLLSQNVETELRKLLKASTLWKEVEALTPQKALWEAWATADVAEELSQRALAHDSDSDYFDDVLDSVIALFRVADIWQQRNPQRTVAEFARELLESDVATDTIAATAYRHEGIQVLTPEQAVGRHWDVVAIYGLQDGSWPDLRLRQRLLRADLLGEITRSNDPAQEVIDDPRIQRRSVLDDELRRLLAAVSRTNLALHIGVVSNEDQAPSQFVELVAQGAGIEIPEDGFAIEDVPPALDLSGHISRLRYLAAQEHDFQTSQIATRLLAILARRGVPSAIPSNWIGAGGISSDSPIYEQQRVAVSPSSFDSARQCILRWFFASNSGTSMPTQSAADGTLIHSLAERFPCGPRSAVMDALEEEIRAMGVDEGQAASKIHMDHLREMASALGEYLEQSTQMGSCADPNENVQVEVPFDVPISSVHIRGRIDRMEVESQGVRIIDFKTGKKGNKTGAKKDPDHPQLALYQLAVEQLGYEVLGAELKYLGYGDVRTISQDPLDPETRADWISQLDEIGQKMKGPSFIATPSDEACQYCEFARSCPAREQGKRSVE